MFNPDFYPTPAEVIQQMCFNVDLLGKTILEPSAGSGAIIDFLVNSGADVIACENDPELSRIVKSKCRFLTYDFFDVDSTQVSHINAIVMNPPFSAADKHILHAWEIAPEGCEIVALCNYETIRNTYSSTRGKLHEIIKRNGTEENIGEVFSTATRKTDVKVALIHLYKPRINTETEFEGYFDLTEEEEAQQNGIMAYNEIRNIVNRYVGAVKLYDQVLDNAVQMQSLIGEFERYGDNLTFTCTIDAKPIKRDDFKKELQKKAWKSIFSKLNMDKYVTQSVRDDINRFSEQQSKVPFTMKNIYKMFEIIIGTHSGRMDRVLVKAFDWICSLSAQNSEAGEKWKTNSNYKVNRRFIDTYICEYDLRYPSLLTSYVKVRWNSSYRIDDTIKALCYLTGKDYNIVNYEKYIDHYGREALRPKTLMSFFSENKIDWGQWVQWNEFFRIRGYKKGTMHFEFIDEKVWMDFNRRVAKIKGWALPRKTDTKTKGTERTQKAGVDLFTY